MQNEEQSFKWNNIDGTEFCSLIDGAYEEIVHWKRNIFLVPSGRSGKEFVRELANLYQSYADASPLECIAFKACSVMQSLLPQKPFAKSKTKDHPKGKVPVPKEIIPKEKCTLKTSQRKSASPRISTLRATG